MKFSFTILGAGVLLGTCFLIQFSTVETAAIVDQGSAHFKAQQQSCSDLCGFCPSCNGFYCGEECICECQQDANEHAQCINKIVENSDKLGLMYDVLIQLPSSAGNHGGIPTSSSTRFSRGADPGKHHHAVMDADDIATFRKVLFSNFGPSTSSSSSLAKLATTDAHLTGVGVHQTAGATISNGAPDEVQAQFPLEPATPPRHGNARQENVTLAGANR
nr:uncharacterized protein LOC109397329 isoform X1 [Aedes albopictus]